MTTRELTYYWLRWVLLTPFSLGAGLLVSSIFGFILSHTVDESSLERYKHACDPFIISFISVILAYWIAPKQKSRTAIVVCGIWLFIITLLFLITTTNIKLYGQEYEIKDGGTAIVMIICGLAFAYYLIWRSQVPRVKPLM